MLRPTAWAMGVALIVLVAIIWSASTVLVQAIFAELHFERPFFLTYVANTCFVSLLPLRALASSTRVCVAAVWGRLTDDLAEDRQALSATHRRALDADAVNADIADTDATGASPSAAAPADSLRQVALSSLVVCPIWFAANFFYNASLAHTTVTSSTVLSASSSAFTLLLSVLILKEPFGWLKLAGVLLCWAGNALTVFGAAYGGWNASDGAAAGVRLLATTDAPHQTVGGVLLCSASALLYAVYTVTIRWISPADVTLLFGLLGAINGLLFVPVVLSLHYTGREDLSPLSGEGGRRIMWLLLVKVLPTRCSLSPLPRLTRVEA